MVVQPLQGMFASVPQEYDRLNRILTWGLDRKWRRLAARECLQKAPSRVLDLCTGTGDLAIAIAKLAEDEIEIVGADFSKPMLSMALKKVSAGSLKSKISFVLADAAELPFADGYFDAVGMAFGFRNLTYKNPHRDRYLKELSRVVAPGGRLVIVETSQPRSRWLRAGFHLYLKNLAEPLGGLLSGQPNAYRYLARSACGFYDSGQVTSLLDQAGLQTVSFQPLMGGIAGIHLVVRCLRLKGSALYPGSGGEPSYQRD